MLRFFKKRLVGAKMKRRLFLLLFIISHFGFFFLYMQKRITTIKDSFGTQKDEHFLEKLVQKKEELINQLQVLHNKREITQFAHDRLGLIPVKLTQIHRIDYD